MNIWEKFLEVLALEQGILRSSRIQRIPTFAGIADSGKGKRIQICVLSGV